MSDNQDPSSILFEGGGLNDGAVYVLELAGQEALSHLFELTLTIQPSAESGLFDDDEEKSLLTKPGRLVLGESGRRIWGVFRELELLPGEDALRPTYRAVMVPRLWYMTLTKRSRVFVDMTVPEIVQAVLEDGGESPTDDFTLRLGGTYPKREYTLQYAESDFAFLSRLLEAEGIFYFFEHDQELEASADKGGDHLVIADENAGVRAPGNKDASPVVPFKRATHTTSDEKGNVIRFGARRRIGPAEVVFVDYDWRAPSLDLVETGKVPALGRGSHVFEDEHYRTPGHGQQLVARQAQRYALEAQIFTGTTTTRFLAPGTPFRLEEHFVSALDQEYLVVRMTHRAVQIPPWSGAGTAEAYRNEITAVRFAQAFRPAKRTPKPRIDGVLYATIDGTDGVAAPIDELGRYKVRISFDTGTSAGKDTAGKGSAWIRMAQPLAGPDYGIHFPLRVGTGVLLSHVFGDPDRPIIVGALPEAHTPTPVTKANATQSIIRTSGGITIQFDDNA